MFVEAIVLPWDLVLDGKNGTKHLTKVSRDQPFEPVEYCGSEDYQGHTPAKRCKTDYTSSRALSSGLIDDLVDSEVSKFSRSESSEEQTCTSLSSHEISCLVTFRSVNDHSFISSGILHCTETSIDFQNLTAEKILLEFNSENVCKYQVCKVASFFLFSFFHFFFLLFSLLLIFNGVYDLFLKVISLDNLRGDVLTSI